jgi:hypothetical protein
MEIQINERLAWITIGERIGCERKDALGLGNGALAAKRLVPQALGRARIIGSDILKYG